MKRLAAVAALLGLAAVTACSAGNGNSSSSGGGLYTTIDALKPGLDVNAPINPYNPKGNAFRGYNSMWLGWTKNHMTDPNQFYPGIAESWEIAPDQSSITIKLQPNNKWSDGKPVTAEDVKVSIGLAYTQGGTAYALDPKAAGAASDIQVIDDKTIKITQAADNPSVTFVRGIMETIIVPEHIWGGLLPADFWDKVKTARTDGPAAEAARKAITDLAPKVLAFAPKEDVSAGPFKLERMNPGEALLVKNKNFYNAAKVAPDQVKILNYNGNEQIWSYLTAGKLDSAPFTAVPADVMKRIAATPGNGVVRGYSPVGNSLAFNQSKKPYDNVHVRRGLAHLINRDQVTKVASPEGGTASATTSGMHQRPAAEWLGAAALKSLEPYKGGVAKADEEFKKAGLKKVDGKWALADGKPWKLTINVPASFSDWLAGAKSVTSQLNDAGVSAEVVTTADYPLYLEELAAGKYDVGMWLVALGPAPYNIYQRLYGTSNGWQLLAGKLKHVPAGKEGNWMGGPETIEVDGEKVDPGELTHKLNSVTGDEQKKIIAKLAKAANQDLPVIQLWDYVNTQFINTNRFTGFPENDSDLLRLTSGVWIQLGLIKKK
ncbi:peptide/nickel transport system substrate-binding protein [Sinosporangium album]|uniref:Peptide/nickel transport system substrate-binding protein n=1 Tax=Sinosporangium album TaxID=504805 RepID=A0A1G7SZ28_9ACTN|nr:ABC transporter substrate-binding protein [Sinosporangium album]SDG28231.1 peptide/nickel transport system substrate-binding protein [Sinosporangium album]